MIFSVAVEVRGLEGVADPEGRTIERALPALGFSAVSAVHVGKLFRFRLDAPDEECARAEVEELCRKLLANPVIERAEIRLDPEESEPEREGSPPGSSEPGSGPTEEREREPEGSRR